MGPTVAGFLTFVRTVMGIAAGVLPDSSPAIQAAYDYAIVVVNASLAGVPSPATSPSIYAQAVYNLAGDALVNAALDVPGGPTVPGSSPPAPYFQALRQSFNIHGFVGGVISSTGDEGTNESMVVPDAIKLFTMMNLQQLKTPWGRQYMAIAQSYGNLFGMD
jgi:hypothetical protein